MEKLFFQQTLGVGFHKKIKRQEDLTAYLRSRIFYIKKLEKQVIIQLLI